MDDFLRMTISADDLRLGMPEFHPEFSPVDALGGVLRRGSWHGGEVAILQEIFGEGKSW